MSAPLPGPEGHILFPPCYRPLELMNASALLVIAQGGQVIAGQGEAEMGEANAGEADREAAALHAALHEAAERGCLAHLPAPHASALMLSPEWGLDQLTIGSMRFVGEIAAGASPRRWTAASTILRPDINADRHAGAEPLLTVRATDAIAPRRGGRVGGCARLPI